MASFKVHTLHLKSVVSEFCYRGAREAPGRSTNFLQYICTRIDLYLGYSTNFSFKLCKYKV